MAKKYTFKVGDLVEIVTATFGFGKAVKGDLCFITHRIEDPDEHKLVYTLDEDNKRFVGWNCLEEDIMPFDITDKKKVTERLFKRYTSFLLKVPSYATDAEKILKVELDKLYHEIQQKALTLRANARYISTWKERVIEEIQDKSMLAKFGVLLQTAYESIEYDPVTNCLVGLTRPVTTKVRNVPLEFGRYSVWLHYRDGLTHINRAKGDAGFDRKGNLQHPHILDCKPCLGDYHLPIVQAKERDDFLTIFETVYNYLGTVYEGSVYGLPFLWAPDRTKRCKNCWMLMKDCTCGSKVRFNPMTNGDVLREGEDASLFSHAATSTATAASAVMPEEDVARCTHCNNTMAACTCFFCPIDDNFVSTDGNTAPIEECRGCEFLDTENYTCTHGE